MRLVLIVMVPLFVSMMVIVNHDKEIATPAPVPPQGKNTCLLFTVVTVTVVRICTERLSC